jgi:hypothetical protein
LGVLIAEGVTEDGCLSRAINAIPSGVPMSSQPQTVQSVGSFRFQGCFRDSEGNRALGDGYLDGWGENGMTVEKCIEAASGYRYAGLEYSG